MIEHLSGIAQGLMQEAKDLKDVMFVLVKMMVRHCLPHNGIVFLEGKKVNNLEQLRKVLEAWDGDFTKIPGQSVKADKKDKPVSSSSHFRGEGKPSCGMCGKIGHKSEVWRSPAVIAVVVIAVVVIAVVVQPAQSTPITCFICGQPGHKSPDCREKGKGTKQVKKEVESVRTGSINIVLNGKGRKNREL